MNYDDIRKNYLMQMLNGHCNCVIEFYGYCPWCFLMNRTDRMKLNLHGLILLREDWISELLKLEKE
jgi:hypothetical protein